MNKKEVSKLVPDERRGRAPTLLDFVDYQILSIMVFTERVRLTHNFKDIKEALNLTHPALQVHVNRLKKFGLIDIAEGIHKSENTKNQTHVWKMKFVNVTDEGKKVYYAFSKNMSTISKDEDYQRYIGKKK